VGTLYIVSTPTGNNEDISNRALKTLKQADIVVGEEGKTVARLLHDHRITKKLEELNEHNENEQTRTLMQLLKNGKTLALVSDAGTPLLADPGAQLVRKAIEAGIPVRAIPGVTSIMAALTTSGLPMDSFVFAGFVSREPGERLQELKRLAQEPRTVALLETPYRLVPLLEAARQIMPQRRAYLGCNLTMDSETHHYGTVSELYTKFVVSRFKGEFVFCFEGVKGGQPFTPQGADSARDDRRERKPFNRDGGNRDGGFRREGGNREGGFKGGRDSGNREGGFRSRPEGGREGGFRTKPEDGRAGGFKGKQDGGSREGGSRDSGRGGDFRRGGRPDNARGGGFKREGNFRRDGGGGKPQGNRPHGDKPQGDKPQGDKPQGDTPKGE
jgi:16S rRNA (cytidine1402-2'-O)-methyltransferase